ncbi:MAG: hypothetical protein U0X39_05310 [Bacteroidales bacterium]
MGFFGIYELLMGLLVLFFILLIPKILFLLTMQNTLREVKPENRRMDPGLVWLSLIPLFGVVWQFFIVINVADSLKAEFNQRNINAGEDRPGFGIGLAYCILNCCGIVPFLGILAAIAGFICWIIYWVQISGFKDKLVYSRQTV